MDWYDFNCLESNITDLLDDLTTKYCYEDPEIFSETIEIIHGLSQKMFIYGKGKYSLMKIVNNAYHLIKKIVVENQVLKISNKVEKSLNSYRSFGIMLSVQLG